MVNVAKNSVLIIIDVQKGFDDPRWGKRNNQGAESAMSEVLKKFRENARTIVHVRHDSRNPDSLLREGKPSFEFKDAVKPGKGELVITKHVHSAFIGTDLEKVLRNMGEPEIYLMGITTDHCVSTTARMSGDLGFRTYIIEDACAAHEREDVGGEKFSPELVHRVNLASINGEFAEVIRSEDLFF